MTVSEIEKACRDYRRGRITDERFRLKLATFVLTSSPYYLSLIAEKVEDIRSTEEP